MALIQSPPPHYYTKAGTVRDPLPPSSPTSDASDTDIDPTALSPSIPWVPSLTPLPKPDVFRPLQIQYSLYRSLCVPPRSPSSGSPPDSSSSEPSPAGKPRAGEGAAVCNPTRPPRRGERERERARLLPRHIMEQTKALNALEVQPTSLVWLRVQTLIVSPA